MNIETFCQKIKLSNKRSIAKAITLIESKLTSDSEKADALLESLLPYTGQSLRIGITGIPGVGKSTFIEALGQVILENPHHKLAVLTIDPTSPVTGGSLLGDKTRMAELSTHNRVFIRPSPSLSSSLWPTRVSYDLLYTPVPPFYGKNANPL